MRCRRFESPHPDVSARMSRVALAMALCVGAAVQARAAEPPPFSRVSLAGTFNNWQTADGAYTLAKAGERYELVHYWSCGRYEVKFVFDGSWARHWGAGPGGTLTQPGENIALVIPQSGTYAISLDPAAARWELSRRAPAKPRAIIRVVGADTQSAEVVLDARLSEA